MFKMRTEKSIKGYPTLNNCVTERQAGIRDSERKILPLKRTGAKLFLKDARRPREDSVSRKQER